MPMVENAMIPPGSVGWMRGDDELLRPADLMEPPQIESKYGSGLGDYRDSDDPRELTEPTGAGSDVDGELEFIPLPE